MSNPLLTNRLYYIIWLGNPTSLIASCKPYEQYATDRKQIQEALSRYIDIDAWFLEFSELYRAWVEDGSLRLYDIHDEINASMMTAIAKSNIELEPGNITLLYWFDSDRSELGDEWEWTADPIDNAPLTNLGPEYYSKSRLVCEKHRLVFPDKDA